ncbi:hypothetical protein RB195_021922 [Necator americanus]|uniref:Uncharacterized protein n=1 Tax=Necator americanus TaxID=51031 RepID=A0ABR1ED81_NECAM
MYGSETWAAPSTVMERLDCTEIKLLRRLFGYFWPMVCHNEDLHAEIDVVYWRMTRGRHQHLAPPSKVAKTDVVKEELRTLGVERQFRREVRSRRIWNSDEWIDSAQALAEDREGWAQLCSKKAHLDEDAGNRLGDDISPPIKSSRDINMMNDLTSDLAERNE